MTRPLSPAELTDLLGAYAADAVAPWEAEQIESLLATDPAARAELEEHRDALASLAVAVSGEPDPPAKLWQRIATGLSDAPPPLRLVPAAKVRRVPRPVAWLGGLAAAAVIAAVAVVGANALRSDTTELPEAAASAATAPGAEVLALADPVTGEVGATITLLPDGVGYFEADLPPLPPHRTYQLWAVVGDEVVSAGVLGPDPGLAPFQVAGDVALFAVTEESAGGVAASANTPLAVWQRDA